VAGSGPCTQVACLSWMLVGLQVTKYGLSAGLCWASDGAHLQALEPRGVPALDGPLDGAHEERLVVQRLKLQECSQAVQILRSTGTGAASRKLQGDGDLGRQSEARLGSLV
jgi:hypothetical protein